MANGNFYSGTSGIVLPARNKTEFPSAYQNKSRLNYYSSLNNSLEVNSSFYTIPQGKTVEKWAAETGTGFKLTFKLWRGITHNKGLTFNTEDVKHFMEVISLADNKKGCLLIQFPASINAEHIDQLKELLSAINEYNTGWQIAVEFRSKTWYTNKTYQVIKKYNSTIVIHDMPASVTPIGLHLSNAVYLRFHGPHGRYGGSYNDSFLAEYASYITDWLKDGKTVYAYFNNTMGDAVNNLKTLQRYVT